MSKRVRQLTEDGVESFRQYLHALRMDGTLPPPYELLEDNQTSAAVRGVAVVENIHLGRRLDAARYLVRILENLDPNEYENNSMWSWLSLFYFDQLCPENSKGLRKPGKDYRYIPTSEFRGGRHRHLLKIPFSLYRLHAEKARILLSNEIDKPGDFNEQISNRQNLVASVAVMEALELLYLDEEKGCPKRGVIDKGKVLTKPGSLNRFWHILNQLQLTYDLFSLTGTEVFDLLPGEFKTG